MASSKEQRVTNIERSGKSNRQIRSWQSAVGSPKQLLIFLALLYSACILYVGFIAVQGDFVQIIVPYSFCFLVYLFLIKEKPQLNYFVLLIAVAISLRFILIFSFPNLSDDVYRFIWDGRCMHHGINPYQYLPSEMIGKHDWLAAGLFEKLNSPNYFSIYPPIGQFVAYLATFFETSSYYLESVLLKCFVFAAEVGSIFFGLKLLEHFGLSSHKILIYALNPLILLEIMGNIHFEGFMIFFILLALWLLVKSKYTFSALSLSLGIACKLLPLMFLPLFVAFFRDRKAIVFSIITGVALLLLFLPFLAGANALNLSESVDLFVKKFEFNGSIYYLLRAGGYALKGFNTIHIIGPILSACIVLFIFAQALAFSIKKLSIEDLITFMLFAFTTYLLLATIVHPWYLAMPLALCMFTRFRFPVVWSGLIFFTYVNYSYAEYFENLWVVGVEYLIVYGVIIYEMVGRKINGAQMPRMRYDH